jgi:hypothetical protein
MPDGSRHFASLPQLVVWQQMAAHVSNLTGVSAVQAVTDGVTEGWIDFRYENQSFTINDQHGEYWLFVSDPSCPDDVLTAVAEHCSALN